MQCWWCGVTSQTSWPNGLSSPGSCVCSAPAGTGHPHQAYFCSQYSHGWGQGFTCWAGLGRQKEAEDQTCLWQSKQKGTLGKENRSLET